MSSLPDLVDESCPLNASDPVLELPLWQFSKRVGRVVRRVMDARVDLAPFVASCHGSSSLSHGQPGTVLGDDDLGSFAVYASLLLVEDGPEGGVVH